MILQSCLAGLFWSTMLRGCFSVLFIAKKGGPVRNGAAPSYFQPSGVPTYLA
jgi:hypothetical protein